MPNGLGLLKELPYDHDAQMLGRTEIFEECVRGRQSASHTSLSAQRLKNINRDGKNRSRLFFLVGAKKKMIWMDSVRRDVFFICL